jgi:hypothetical protein
MAPPYQKTVDGFELQFGTNHLGKSKRSKMATENNNYEAKWIQRIIIMKQNGYRE